MTGALILLLTFQPLGVYLLLFCKMSFTDLNFFTKLHSLLSILACRDHWEHQLSEFCAGIACYFHNNVHDFYLPYVVNF